jgi:hypothetical protein
LGASTNVHRREWTSTVVSVGIYGYTVFRLHSILNGDGMSTVKEFQCEICGIVSENPSHWFVIECGDRELTIVKWDLTAALNSTARHFCGEAHAQVYISRWFESVCVPLKAVSRPL